MLVELNLNVKARYRSDGRYEIRPQIDGRRVSIYGQSAEELAKKYRLALQGKRKEEKSAKVTLFKWFDEWIEVYKKPNVSKSTLKNIEYCVKNHLKPNLKDKPINRYTLTDLTQALNQIEKSRMRQYARGTLRAAFGCAVAAGHLKTSPAVNLLPVKHVVQRGKAFPLLDLKEQIEASADKLPRSLMLYYLFCLFAGTRRDEALNLKGGDCDFKNKIIYIPGTKTQGSKRRIPMFPILEKILVELNASKDEKVFNVSQHRTNQDFRIFRGEHDGAVLHWLRHTFGTIQICVLDIPANTVALWLGHVDATTTIGIYTHPEDLAPDIYFSGQYAEPEKKQILLERYNKIISTAEKFLELPPL